MVSFESLIAKKEKIAIVGLGYVGLPVSCEFARVGFDVLGIDVLARLRKPCDKYGI